EMISNLFDRGFLRFFRNNGCRGYRKKDSGWKSSVLVSMACFGLYGLLWILYGLLQLFVLQLPERLRLSTA
ncbi:hypothetical protein AAK899_03455, partial [Erysipelotrichaceae bacterium 51-3]